jgi:octaprenyl-diphosphate synthase
LNQFLHKDVPFYSNIIKHLNDNKGKQIRAKLSLLCAKLGGDLNERSFRAAMIVEMLHTASLLHDDIVDNSKERRGVSSINSKWGAKIALLSGDIISLRALLLSLSNHDYDIFRIFGLAVEQIVQGELLQLKKTVKLNTEETTYFKIIKGKTAAFFSAACESGAITTFKNASQIEQLRLFGENIGMAFQIRDDLFGFGNQNVGKPIDNDFKEKKLTLPIIYSLNKMDFWKRCKLKRIIKQKSISGENIEFIIELVKLNGGIDYANEKMQEFGQNAIDILNGFPKSETRSELEELIKYATARIY